MSLLGQGEFRVDRRMPAFASKADIPSLMARTVSRWWRDATAVRSRCPPASAGRAAHLMSGQQEAVTGVRDTV